MGPSSRAARVEPALILLAWSRAARVEAALNLLGSLLQERELYAAGLGALGAAVELNPPQEKATSVLANARAAIGADRPLSHIVLERMRSELENAVDRLDGKAPGMNAEQRDLACVGSLMWLCVEELRARGFTVAELHTMIDHAEAPDAI